MEVNKMANVRDFTIKGVDFHIGNYRPRKNEFEKGLKYQLFVKVYDGMCVVDGKVVDDFRFQGTSIYGSTIKEIKETAKREIYRWL